MHTWTPAHQAQAVKAACSNHLWLNSNCEDTFRYWDRAAEFDIEKGEVDPLHEIRQHLFLLLLYVTADPVSGFSQLVV